MGCWWVIGGRGVSDLDEAGDDEDKLVRMSIHFILLPSIVHCASHTDSRPHSSERRDTEATNLAVKMMMLASSRPSPHVPLLIDHQQVRDT